MFFSAGARHCRAMSLQIIFGSTQSISVGWPSRSLEQTPAIAALPPEWAPGQEAKEATVPAVTATLAPDVRVTVRKELLRRVDFALYSKKNENQLIELHSAPGAF